MAYEPVLIEQWTEYAVGTVIFLIRIYARLSVAGWRKFLLDDFIILISIGLYTGVHVSVFVLNNNISFVDVPDHTILDDGKLASFKRGSKAVAAAWSTYITQMWLLKACWLCIFSRLTLGTQQQRLIKLYTSLVIVAYVFVLVMIMVRCIPSTGNWTYKLDNGSHEVVHGRHFQRWAVMDYIRKF